MNRGTRSALCFWLLTSGPFFFLFLKPCSCKACPGISGFWPREVNLSNEKGDRALVFFDDCRTCLARKAFTTTKKRRSTGQPTCRVAEKPTVSLALQGIVDNCPEQLLEKRTKEISLKPMEEPNPRLTRRSSAVYHWGHERSSFLAADQCTDAYLSL